MVRKKHKPIEQTTAENFFPVDEKSLIKVTEKIEAEVNRRGLLGLRSRSKVSEVGNDLDVRVPKPLA